MNTYYKDYSNTEIFSRNTKNKETKEINYKLKNMYSKFFDEMRQRANKNNFQAYGYNGIQLLTCFDSYLDDSKNKVMCFGKEANTPNGQLLHYAENYQKDSYYSYDYAIAHPQNHNIPDCHRTETEYLKTRKIISLITKEDIYSCKNDELEGKVLSIMNNNLNKTSIGGKYTPCKEDDELSKMVYFNFEFDGFDGNIILHELNILQPTHIIFLSGKGYDEHIKRDFGKEIYVNIIKNLIAHLEFSKNAPDKVKTVSESIQLTENESKEYFGINNYSPKIIYAYHPSSHMKKDVREKYNTKLAEFVRT